MIRLMVQDSNNNTEGFERVTLISEMDLFLRNGRNGDFFMKWS